MKKSAKKAHLDSIRPKALMRRKALALVREVGRTRCITRMWNVHASEDGLTVSVSAPVKELNHLKKIMGVMGIRAEIRSRHLVTVCEPREFWGYLILTVKK